MNVAPLEPAYREPEEVLRLWPKKAEILALLGRGHAALVATRFSEVDASGTEELLQRPLAHDRVAEGAFPFGTGWIGLAAYDELAGGRTLRLFRIHEALAFDRRERRLRLVTEGMRGSFGIEAGDLERLLTSEARPGAFETPTFELVPRESDASYERKVARALEDIRRGRYYQINLLRYYQVAGSPGRSAWLERLFRFGGPMSAALFLDDDELISFSPERFVSLIPEADGIRARTFPIKGTAPRADDPVEDARLAETLITSGKDRAELHMIVDLMRNDLARVSRLGSVKVEAAARLESFENVHHLVAEISSLLMPGTTLGDLLTALHPGGSITGAPKVEVMKVIRELEGRPRGAFMGSLFWLGDDGRFDSSILIRTVVRQGSEPYEFAAGSGIVIRSRPELERLEVEAKGRVLTEPLPARPRS